MRFTLERTVAPEMAADRWGNDGVQVLSTPDLVGLFEAACGLAIKDAFAPGESSVGTQVNVRHLKATPVGDTVTVVAEVTEVDGRRIVFQVSALDSTGPIGEGMHERVLVDLERFLRKVYAQAGDSAPAPPVGQR